MRGSTQGGVLSPLVWNLILNTLLSSFKRTDVVKVVGNSDNILLYVFGSDEVSMEAALERVTTFGAVNGLVFNTSKTTV